MHDNPQIVGIVNVTPDSFSDGGSYFKVEDAARHGFQLVEEGADILDVGGESTRPGADPVSVQEEIDRVCPVIEKLKDAGVPISIDTRHAKTMEMALHSGAVIVNDISALIHDENSVVAAKKAEKICIMHMQNTPQTMQQNPQYDDVVETVFEFLEERISFCEKNGIARAKLMVDPGIGFGKTLDHNLVLLKNLSRFHDLGVPLFLGVSRKSFIGALNGDVGVDQRLPGSIAAALWCAQQGAHYLRVHDVAATKQALCVYQAICSSA